METLDYIKKRFNLDWNDRTRMPIEIPNFGRDLMAEMFNELEFTLGAEVGVESGVYSDILLRSNPHLTLYSIDAWVPHKGYRDHVRREKFNQFYEDTKEILAKYGGRSVLLKMFSMDAVKEFEDEQLDFVYLDGNHNFVNVSMDMHFWLPKIKKGGILAGHDYRKYGDNTQIHVVQAVNGFTDSYKIKPWFVLGTNAMLEGEVRDKSRSWMIVKQ